MILEQLARRISPELRISAYYFVNFTTPAVVIAYGSIWFAEKGLSPGEIGMINSVPVFIMLGLNLLVGRLADRASDWRQVIVIGALAAAIIPFGLFATSGFWAILLVWTLATLPVSAIAPVADAASIRLTKRNGTDFGAIRAWGTVGYMVANVLTGPLIGAVGSAIFVPLYVLSNVLRGLFSLLLPKFRAPAAQATLAAALQPPAGGRLREVMQPWFLLPLIGYSIVFGTHMILNAFAALLWKEQGIPTSVIGPLVALGALAEAATMFAWKRFGGRFSARFVLLVAALTSALRWALMGFSPPIYGLVFVQLLQSPSFALGYLGAVHFVAKWTREEVAAEVQSFLTVLQQAGSILAVAGFGWLIGIMGAKSFLVAALLALLGGLCIWISMRLKQPQSDPA